MIIKFSTKKIHKLIYNLTNNKILIIIEYYKNIYENDIYLHFNWFINIDVILYYCDFHNTITNDFIKEHHNIYKQYVKGVSYINAKEKYKERINIFMIKNKICFDLQNVILSFLI